MAPKIIHDVPQIEEGAWRRARDSAQQAICHQSGCGFKVSALELDDQNHDAIQDTNATVGGFNSRLDSIEDKVDGLAKSIDELKERPSGFSAASVAAGAAGLTTPPSLGFVLWAIAKHLGWA